MEVPQLKKHQFKKGQSGNPGGRPKLDPVLRKIKEINAIEVKRIISRYVQMTKAELTEALKNPDIPMIDLHIATILSMGAKQGDYSRLGFLFERLIGPVPKEPAVSVSVNMQSLPPERVVAIAKDAIKYLEETDEGSFE
jgi:hypothetical protein